MPRIGIFNIMIGFLILFFSACAGSFLSVEVTKGFVHDQALLQSWQLTLLRSSHSHTNLFGMLHVLFGLTLPYAQSNNSIKKWQTIGLLLGSLAMGPGMMVRAFGQPSESIDLGQIIVGTMLSCALVAIAMHVYGLAMKFFR